MNATLIKKSDAKIVDLQTKIIKKYTPEHRNLEVNVMEINGRHPENSEHFVLEKECHFMIYILNGSGKVYCNDEIFQVEAGDVVDVPVKTRFAVEGNPIEYLTVDLPAWFPEQASIVDKEGNIIIDNNAA